MREQKVIGYARVSTSQQSEDKNGYITAVEAAKRCNMPVSTFKY